MLKWTYSQGWPCLASKDHLSPLLDSGIQISITCHDLWLNAFKLRYPYDPLTVERMEGLTIINDQEEISRRAQGMKSSPHKTLSHGTVLLISYILFNLQPHSHFPFRYDSPVISRVSGGIHACACVVTDLI